MIKFVGWIVEYLMRAHSHYMQARNTAVVNNRGGIVCSACKLIHPENIYIGENTYLNGGDYVASPNAKIVIGDNCLISYHVHMRTDMHNYMDSMQLIREQGCSEHSIIVGNDVWIGYGAQIMAGVTIANGCVIGAGAVVTKDTQENGVYGGVPARMIRMRQGIDDCAE